MSLEGARLARQAADEVGGFVAGSVGPLNVSLSVSPKVDDPAYRVGDVRRGARDVCGADRRAPRRRRGHPLDRDGLRHAERESSDRRRSQRRRARASALVVVHGAIEHQRPQPVGPDRRSVLQLGRARRAARSSASTARSAPSEMRPYVAELAALADHCVACYPNAGLPNEFGDIRRAARGHGRLLARVRRDGLAEHRRRLLRHDARAHRARSAPRRGLSPRGRSRSRRRVTRLSGLEPLTIRPDDELRR